MALSRTLHPLVMCLNPHFTSPHQRFHTQTECLGGVFEQLRTPQP